jgi:hypothetical protein
VIVEHAGRAPQGPQGTSRARTPCSRRTIGLSPRAHVIEVDDHWAPRGDGRHPCEGPRLSSCMTHGLGPMTSGMQVERCRHAPTSPMSNRLRHDASAFMPHLMRVHALWPPQVPPGHSAIRPAACSLTACVLGLSPYVKHPFAACPLAPPMRHEASPLIASGSFPPSCTAMPALCTHTPLALGLAARVNDAMPRGMHSYDTPPPPASHRIRPDDACPPALLHVSFCSTRCASTGAR